LAHIHALRPIRRLDAVDHLPLVRPAQHFLHLARLARLLVALDLRHGLTELLRAHRAGLPAQPADGLLDQAKGAVEGEGAAALFAGGREGGRLVRHGVLLAPLAPLALVTAAPAAASAT